MPPRKKQRVSQAISPAPDSEAPVATTLAKTDDAAVLNDPWTDEEEIGLFKGLMRWKPTGIHKHFRLLSLHAWMLENSYIHPRNPHTKPAGIWQKLDQLYDLSTLDAREDARQLSPERANAEQREEEQRESSEDTDVYSVAANKIENTIFELPADSGFEGMMWKARFANKEDQDAESEPEIPELNMADDPPVTFTPSFSIEPSENATPSRSVRPKRGRPSRGGPANANTRRSTRKTESVADKEEQKGEEADGEEQNRGEDSDDEDAEVVDSEDEEESQASTPGPRRGRSSRPTRGKASGRARGRGRGRSK